MGQHFKPAQVVPAPGIAAAADPFAQASEFLARVLPWPETPGTAYVNIANSFRGQNGIAWGGRAVTSLNEAINYVEWVSGQKDTVGVYVCMSTHSDSRVRQK